jgi:aspartyl-tRNA(Asn)/glutamyl-tRNA(Gln) amidotransferase subunit A
MTSVELSGKGKASVDSLKGVRLGVVKEVFEEEFEDETRRAVMDAIEWYKKNGAEIVDIEIPSLKYAIPTYVAISSAEASSNLGRFDGVRFGRRAENYDTYEELIERSRAEGFGPDVKKRILLGVHVLLHGNYEVYYQKARDCVNQLKYEYNQAFQKCDALISPTNPFAAWKFDSLQSDSSKPRSASLCALGAPLTGLPAVSTPCGYCDDGRPIGVRIMGNRFDDRFVLSLAGLFEKEFERKEAVI